MKLEILLLAWIPHLSPWSKFLGPVHVGRVRKDCQWRASASEQDPSATGCWHSPNNSYSLWYLFSTAQLVFQVVVLFDSIICLNTLRRQSHFFGSCCRCPKSRPTTPYSKQSDSSILRDDQAGREEGSCEAKRELPERAQHQRGHRHETLCGSSFRRWGVAQLVIFVCYGSQSQVLHADVFLYSSNGCKPTATLNFLNSWWLGGPWNLRTSMSCRCCSKWCACLHSANGVRWVWGQNSLVPRTTEVSGYTTIVIGVTLWWTNIAMENGHL